MRGYFQQVRGQLVGWILAILATAIYGFTLEPSVSFWDCGEFIVTNYGIEVGHPPGAPVYQLLAHVFTLFAGSNMTLVAWWSNMFSAVAGGMTIAFLYWSILLLFEWFDKDYASHRLPLEFAAMVGSLCFLFCDTAWFNVVESEVYGLAMFFASVLLWVMLRWRRVSDEPGASRWIVLLALLAGLSACVHEMCLLVLPAFIFVYLSCRFPRWRQSHLEGESWVSAIVDGLRVHRTMRIVLLGVFFFVVGLTPYVILPIRAQANTPLNEGDPSTWSSFKSYMNRDQYAKAPIYPRIWRERPNDQVYYADWSGNHAARKGMEMRDCVTDNVQFFLSYQLWYMYGRYLMWNFSGRYNDRQGFGSLQNGQFITGIPPIDRLLVGTGARPPRSLHVAGHNVYFMLPLLLGIVGVCYLYKRQRMAFWTLMMAFLFGGPILAVYLNMPAYEPRERDYAFVISFYVVAVWIAFGALGLIRYCRRSRAWLSFVVCGFLLGVPILMAAQNWDDHDRGGRYFARDYARNYLNSCARNAILFTYGDNDTFPLWYVQEVEGFRKDVQVVNLSLLGGSWYVHQMDQQLNRQGSDLIDLAPGEYQGPYRTMTQIIANNEWERPIYFSHYAKDQYKEAFVGRMQTVGYVSRLQPEYCDSVAVDDFSGAILGKDLSWESTRNVYIDGTSQRLLDYYWRQVVLLVDNLIDRGDTLRAAKVLDTTLESLPYESIDNLEIVHKIATQYAALGLAESDNAYGYLRAVLSEQLDYFHKLSPQMQRFIAPTLAPKEKLWELVQ